MFAGILRHTRRLAGPVCLLVLVFFIVPQRGTAAPPVSPLTSHPRLWVTQNDLPGLRAWANVNNPMYENALKPLAIDFKNRMDNTSLYSGDSGSNYGYTAYPIEWHMELFAFMSLIENDQNVRDDYAQRARTLLMYMMNKAATGPIEQDKDWAWKSFSKDMRSLFYGEAFPLTVDWIYPYLTDGDKATIRTVFKRWLSENLTATTSGMDHPEPVWVLNSSQLLQDEVRRRTAINNFYNAHLNQIGLMSLAFDEADDPGDANDPHDQIRDYLKDAIGAWLYVRHSAMQDVDKGGVPPEGLAYGPTGIGRTSEFMLALYTSGNMDTNVWGPQVSYETPFWNELVSGLLHASSPTTSVLEAWKGPVYLVSDHGDTYDIYLHGYATLLATMGIYARAAGNTQMYNDARWVLTNMEPGGAAKLVSRAGDWNYVRDDILHFLLFAPNAPALTDPRSNQPNNFVASGINYISSRTGWDANARWFTFKLPWMWIDHQMATGNGFEFYRKGEFLTKMWSGYGEYSAGSDYKNTLSLENSNPNTGLTFWQANYAHGSQWVYNSPQDPNLLATSFGTDYTYVLGDATNLYNNPDTSANDINEATRSILWLKPDVVIVYDRAVSQTTNRYKRFMLNLPTASPTINGTRTTATTSGGQKLVIDTLLPASAALSVNTAVPDGNGYDETANYEPMVARLQVTASGNPASTRFLHVLQGLDSNGSPLTPALVQSSSGTAFAGAIVNDTAVMFPVNVGHIPTGQTFNGVSFSSTTYQVPSNVTKHILTGLTPNAGYNVSTQNVSSNLQITVTSGGNQYTADSGGVLGIGITVQPNPTATSTATMTHTPIATSTATQTATPTSTSTATTTATATVTVAATQTTTATPTDSGLVCTDKADAPTPLAPLPNANLNAKRILLDWNNVPCATHYKLKLKRDSKQGALVARQPNLLVSEYRTKTLIRGVTYFWKIKACNAFGCRAAPWQSFRIKL